MKKEIIVIIMAIALCTNALALRQVAGGLNFDINSNTNQTQTWKVISEVNVPSIFEIKIDNSLEPYLEFNHTIILIPGSEITNINIIGRCLNESKCITGTYNGLLHGVQLGDTSGQISFRYGVDKPIQVIVNGGLVTASINDSINSTTETNATATPKDRSDYYLIGGAVAFIFLLVIASVLHDRV